MNNLSLEEVANIYSGNSINSKLKKEKYTDKNFSTPYVATKDLSKNGDFDYNNGVTIPDIELDNFKIAPKGSTLICMEGGSAGKKIGLVKQDVCFVNKLGALVPNEKINKKYLYYSLQTPEFQAQFKSSLNGIIGGVSLSKLKKLQIPVPSLQEQEKIVERLDKVFENIDKKIELNLSNKLEALEESILEKEFFNKEKFQKLENYVELIMGQAPPKSETNFSGKGTLFVKTGEFGDERPVSKEYTTKPLKLAKSTDVLISVVGATCGKINFGIDCAIGRSVAAIRPLSNLNQDYLYYLMKSYTKKLRKGSTGAAQTVINKNMINNVLIPDISKNDQDKTVGEIKTIFSKLESLNQLQEKINEKLILLKKSILNKEFSYEK